jgi:hypothetical protein
MALVVHGDQRLLDDVFHLVRHPGEAPPDEGAQVRGQLAQERVVGRRVAAQPDEEQRAQPLFLFVHARRPVTAVRSNRL